MWRFLRLLMFSALVKRAFDFFFEPFVLFAKRPTPLVVSHPPMHRSPVREHMTYRPSFLGYLSATCFLVIASPLYGTIILFLCMSRVVKSPRPCADFLTRKPFSYFRCTQHILPRAVRFLQRCFLAVCASHT